MSISPDMSDKIQLFGFPQSPYVAKTYLYLLYKDLPFEMIYVNPFNWREIAFAERRMVPVLRIGNEHRYESTQHGYWLDDRFPDTTRIGGNDPKEATRIAELNDFVTSRLIPSFFRMALHIRSFSDWHHNGLCNARAMRETELISPALLPIWPYLVSMVGFVRDHARTAKQLGSVQQMLNDNVTQLAELIGRGPFLGGFDRPTLADLSAYAQVSIVLYIGYRGRENYVSDPVIARWVDQVEARLPRRPELLPPQLQVQSFPGRFASRHG